MFNKRIIFFVLLFASFNLCAQSIQKRDTIAAVDYDSIYMLQKNQVYICGITKFSGGDAGFANYIFKHLKYPKEAIKLHVQGVVYISFAIDTKGNVVDVKVARSAHPILDKAAMDVIINSPKWKQVKNNANPVSAKKIQAINFALD
jgi:TonB family protein